VSPQRIQLHRAKGWRKPVGAVVVSRPSKWGNPFRVGDPIVNSETGVVAIVTAEFAVYMFWTALTSGRMEAYSGHPITLDGVRAELRGRDLACWCRPGQPCHADVLLQIANAADPADGSR
jgi:hypothetical protein